MVEQLSCRERTKIFILIIFKKLKTDKFRGLPLTIRLIIAPNQLQGLEFFREKREKEKEAVGSFFFFSF